MATHFLSGTRLAGFERMMMQTPRPASRYHNEPESIEALQRKAQHRQPPATTKTPQDEERITNPTQLQRRNENEIRP